MKKGHRFVVVILVLFLFSHPWFCTGPRAVLSQLLIIFLLLGSFFGAFLVILLLFSVLLAFPLLNKFLLSRLAGTLRSWLRARRFLSILRIFALLRRSLFFVLRILRPGLSHLRTALFGWLLLGRIFAVLLGTLLLSRTLRVLFGWLLLR